MSTDSTLRPLHVLGFSGSLRKASYNTMALRAAGELLPPGVTLETFDLGEIPLYNGDVEAAGMPAAVVAFQDRIAAADALFIALPEYNASVPGVLKNAIDWASRPYKGGGSPLDGKPTAFLGATPGFLGTSRAQYHLRQICVNVNMLPMQRPEMFITAAHTKFSPDGTLTDDATRQLLAQFLAAFAAWARRLRGDAAG